MNHDLEQKCIKLITNCSNAIISSVDSDGFPNVKAMLKPRENVGLKKFYFTTNTSSLRVKQYSENSKASIYFYDGNLFLGLMLIGKMEVLHDQVIKERIWRDGDNIYYSKGVTDPDYCVLEFVAQKCRLYENFSSCEFEV